MDYDGEICPRYRYDCPQIQYNWRHSAWKTNVFPLSCVYLCDMNFLCLSFSVPLLFVCFLCLYVFICLCLYISLQVSVKKKPFDSMSIFVFFVVSFVEIMTFDRLCLVGMVRKVSVVLRSLNDIVRRRTMSTAGRYHSSHDHFGQKGLQCQQKHFIQRNYTIVLYLYKFSIASLPSPSFMKRQINIKRQINCCIVACCMYIVHHTFIHFCICRSGFLEKI